MNQYEGLDLCHRKQRWQEPQAHEEAEFQDHEDHEAEVSCLRLLSTTHRISVQNLAAVASRCFK